MLVEEDKYLDLQKALELAADVQPMKVDATTVNDVCTKVLFLFLNMVPFYIFVSAVFTTSIRISYLH